MQKVISRLVEEMCRILEPPTDDHELEEALAELKEAEEAYAKLLQETSTPTLTPRL